MRGGASPGHPRTRSLVAVGDIAQCPGNAAITAALVDGLPGTIAALGDTVYENGTPEEYATCYEPTWGRHKARTRPAVGNHEYRTPGASGYFSYFGAAAGEPGKGYYSYTLGAWHVVALNTNCAEIGGCEPGSAQERWLRADLAAHPARCTVAYMHHPAFSSGNTHGGSPSVRPLLRALQDEGVELILSGHDHDYERFAPQTVEGAANPAGVRQFVVGTGGASLREFAPQPAAQQRGADRGRLRRAVPEAARDRIRLAVRAAARQFRGRCGHRRLPLSAARWSGRLHREHPPATRQPHLRRSPRHQGDSHMPEAVIVDAVRTPIGRAFKGQLAGLRPDDTGAFVVDSLLERNPEVSPESVEELIAGCGLPQGLQAFNIGRIMVLLSERLPDSVNGVTVSRYCASSLESIREAANAIRAGEGDTYIAAGVEWVSRYNERQEAAGVADQNEKLQGNNGQPNAYIAMGLTAENVADKWEVSRADMDKYAQRSQELAVASQESGFFDREIVPVTLPDGTMVAKDEGPRASSTLEKLAELKPAFREDGKVTAGNSCPLNDGAAAVLLMSDARAKELGLTPRARIVASATAALEPELMGVAPIGAIKKVLDRAGMKIDDVDVVELNEAFAAQVIPIMSECDIPLEKLNPHGGAIALGHPFGMTGARIMTTLLNGLETDDKTIGLETMCVAGGQGHAMIVERLN